VRRELDEYAVGGAPPHVQAARMLQKPGVQEVEYLMTVRGPEPIDRRTAPIDHAHYLEKQLAPACDVILHLHGTSFDAIAGSQRSLF
jgi:DNA polymerase-2